MIPKVLSIAGSDPSGGAGIQADLKTFSALGCYGMAAMTALTAQNTKGVQSIHPIPAQFLEGQLTCIFEDVLPDAIKIGMVGDAQSIAALAAVLERFKARNIVLDPVMVATSGDQLIDDDAVEALKTYLMPLADVMTPNMREAELLGSTDAQKLLSLGSKAVLVKGGHGDGGECVDMLATSDGVKTFSAARIDTENTHGTGCTLSSAIACGLAREEKLSEAVKQAKHYVTNALRNADILDVGEGAGPVHHFWDMWS